MNVTLTPIIEFRPEADPERCACCGERAADLRRNIEAWWQPSPGHGYGENGCLISLCADCILTLQFFVETPHAR